jgi:cytochrome c-type biogenesis protein CcmH/NrfG
VLADLLKLRRHSEDWRLFGICQAASGDLGGAQASLGRALAINPFRAELHIELARVLTAAGQPQAARRHQRLAELLRKKP